MSQAGTGWRHIWRWPVLIGIASAFGLMCALLADGAWDVAGAGSLAVPGVIALWLIGKFLAGRQPWRSDYRFPCIVYSHPQRKDSLMSIIILLMTIILAVLPVHAVLAQEVEDKVKAETDGENKPETEGKKTDKVRLKIKEIVVTGDKIGRLAVEAPPSITIVEGEEAEQPINRHIKMILRKAANVFVEEGIQLPSVRGIDGSGGGRQAITAGVQPRVPILIDDAPRPLNNSFAISRSSSWDVSSMEIARGPERAGRRDPDLYQ